MKLLSLFRPGPARGPSRAWGLAAAGALCAGLALGVRAEAPADDVPTRQAFLASDDVQTGLSFLVHLSRHLPNAPQDTSWLEAACWDGVSRLLRARPAAATEQVDACLDAAATHLDPEASFHRPDPLNRPSGPAGVGLSLKLAPEGGLQVIDAFPGSPAVRAGVRVGDRITAIDGRPAAGQPLYRLIDQVRGAAGTVVRLAVVSAGSAPGAAARDVPVTRARFATPPVFVVPLRRVLYVQVRDFGTDLPGTDTALAFGALVRQAVAREPVDTVVLDLRGNAGGLTRGILNLAAALMPDAHLGMLQFNADGSEHDEPAAGMAVPELRGKSLVLLVDGETGSGSEWLAETARREAGALVVGRTTAGGLKIRRGYFVGAAMEGARFNWPESEIFARDGTLVAGHGVTPDVALVDADLPRAPMGQAPGGLQAWLDTRLAPARHQREQRAREDRTHRYATPASGATLCSGLAVMPLPAGLDDLQARPGTAWLRTDTWRLQIETVDDPIAFGVLAERQRWTDAVKAAEDQLEGLRRAAAPEQRRIAFQERELAAAQGGLARLKSWDLGAGGAQMIRSGGEDWLVWPQPRLAVRIRLTGVRGDMTEADRLAAYTALAGGLRLLPRHAAPPARPGVCIGEGFMALSEPIDELQAVTEWTSAKTSRFDVPARAVSLVTRYAASRREDDESPDRPGLVSDGGRQDDDDEWLIDRQEACDSSTWPRLAPMSLAGLEAVSRRSTDAAGEGGGHCRVLGALSRLPQARSPGPILRAGAVLKGDDASALDAQENAWRDALAHAELLPLARP